jgi:hypothetical protein
MDFRKHRLLKVVLAIFVAGCVLGYTGVWVDHYGVLSGVDYLCKDHWTDWLVLFSIPGNLITWHMYGSYDWCIDEDWSYRVPITLWNGVFWSGVFISGLLATKGACRCWRVLQR